MSRLECAEHLDLEHPNARAERPLFCDTCLKAFVDKKGYDQHESYHKRIHIKKKKGDLELVEPEIQEVTMEDLNG